MAILATFAAVGAAVAIRGERPVVAGAALIASAAAPTFGAAALNLIPIAVGAALLYRAARGRIVRSGQQRRSRGETVVGTATR